jgi:tetratricopeptide (TPR) repeat protein
MRPWEQAAALYKAGKAQEVLDYFVGLTDDGVAQFAAAAILLDHGNLALALEHANRARHLVESNSADNYQRLTVSVGITEELRLELAATPEGVTLLIVEIQQRAGDNDQAIQNLRALLSQHGDDAIVKLSLVELLYDRACNDDNLHEVIRLAKRTEATDLACVGLILYKARALYKLGMYDGIPPIMEAIWDARQPLPRDLTLALRYQLGLTYEALGQPESARRQYHHIYAEDPDYEDITVRLRRLSS